MTFSFSRTLARFTTFFTYYLGLFPVFIFFLTYRAPIYSGTIEVDPNASAFNESEDPTWLVHMTDLHCSSYHMDAVNKTKLYLKQTVDIIKPTFCVLSGDLTDNVYGRSVWNPSHPIHDQWNIYDEVMEFSNISNDVRFEVLGNHDTWACSKFNTSIYKHLAEPWKNFYVKSKVRDGIRIVGFQPIDFPSGHTTFHFILPLKPHHLDALEKELNKKTKAKRTVVTMHFTTEMMNPFDEVRSSNQRTFYDILNDPKYNVEVLLDGHTHPATFEVRHFGKFEEITATAVEEADSFYVLSYDNDRINYKQFLGNESKYAILTSPGEKHHATRIFKDEKFQIRVVAFSENAKEFHVSGAVTGDLVFQRKLSSGASLYAMDVNLPAGEYTINISGDLNQTVEFAVNTKVESFLEKKTIDLKTKVFKPAFIVVFLFINMLILGIISGPSHGFLDWLNGEPGAESYWLPAILLGPYYIGKLIRMMPHFMKILIIILFFSPIVAPLGFTIIDKDTIGTIMYYGTKLGDEWNYDIASVLFIYWYEHFTAFSMTYLFVIIYMLEQDFSFIIDYIVYAFAIYNSVKFWNFYGSDRFFIGKFIWLSPVYHTVPAVVGFVYIVYVIYKMIKLRNVKKTKKE